MEVQVFDSAVVKELTRKVDYFGSLIAQVLEENKSLKNDKWMSVSEVTEYTGFGYKWIEDRQQEIGYFQDGKDKRFKKADIDAYMKKYFIQRKSIKQ
jgi:excisionase family DNA binding protein